MNMNEKQVMVVGASSGIGKTCVKYLDSLEFKLILVARKKRQLEELEKDLTQKHIIIDADVQKPEDIERIFEQLRCNKIKLDGLVYSAGIAGVKPLKVINMGFLEEVMKTNCFGFVEMCKYLASKRYSNDGASIVAISSLASLQNYVGELAYCISKAALDSAVKVISKELLGRKIRVNAILPGTTETEMLQSARQFVGDFDEKIRKSQPLGFIDPVYIAYLIEFLLSDETEYVTGTCIPVGAGREIN